MQVVGQKVHITLISPPDERELKKKEQTYKHYEGLHYRIVEALQGTEYDLYKIKLSGKARYMCRIKATDTHPKTRLFWEHQKTNGGATVTNSEHLKEYIFVKVSPDQAPTYFNKVRDIRGQIKADYPKNAEPAAKAQSSRYHKMHVVEGKGQYFVHPEEYENTSDNEEETL